MSPMNGHGFMGRMSSCIYNLCINLAEWRDAQRAGKALFLDVFVRAFLEEVSIWLSRLREMQAPICMVSCNPWKLPMEPRGWERMHLLSLFLSWNVHLLLPWDIGALDSRVFGVQDINQQCPHPCPPVVIMALDSNWIIPPAFLLGQKTMGLLGFHSCLRYIFSGKLYTVISGLFPYLPLSVKFPSAISHSSLLAIDKFSRPDTTLGPLHDPSAQKFHFLSERLLCSLHLSLQPIPLSESRLSCFPYSIITF